MKHVGVREFRDHATLYLSGTEPIAVTKYGRIIGFYFPLERDEDEGRRAIDQVDQTIKQILQEAGPDEDELRTCLNYARIRLHAQSG